MSNDEPPKYNQIFEKLVISYEANSLERLVGMLAYAEYKLDKHEWMQNNPNVSPSELSAFLRYYNQRVLSKYRSDTENYFLIYADHYANQVLKDQLEILKDKGVSEDLKNTETHLTTEIRGLKVGYMMPVWQGVIASAFFTAILFVIALIVRFSAPNSGAGQLLQYFVSPENYELRVIERNKNNP